MPSVSPLRAAVTLSCLIAFHAVAAPIPQLVQKNGKFALMVDGAPFLLLGGQANNSSNYPAMLPEVWPAIKDMKANTLVMPISWEQIEPVEGKFDFSFVDILVEQARQNKVRLGLLWFGTWKNTGPGYTPAWVKRDNQRFPRLTNKDGTTSYSLSPHYESTLEADKKAYVALLRHLKAIDGDQHTVIIVQAQNEMGVYGAVRDYSPKANALIAQPVPQALLTRMNKKPGTWQQVFGDDADEFFYAWSIASYVEQIAAAGKAVYPLPTYVNAAIKEPIKPQSPGSYPSGGPTWNVIDIYKVAAPHIDVLAPDLYTPESVSYDATLKHYRRPDNALFIAESGNKDIYARYIFSALGQQAIGFDPFGFDYTGYANYPLGAKNWGPEGVKPFARVYGLFAPMAREWAKLSFESEVYGVSEPDDHSPQEIDLGPKWTAKVTYRQWQFGDSKWNRKDDFPDNSETPGGGVVVAKLADDEYLVTGLNARINFVAGKDLKDRVMIVDRVEEGRFENGKWVMLRVWNGDQTSDGLNFTDRAQVLKVKLGTYVK
ncbi:MAG TPA: DUF5597 domain-containing protein [Duganella sp.]|nr:DUF5597 domain-containing protein [Duganella sp.]